MFSAIVPETGYRIILRLLKGVTTKLLNNYLLPNDTTYYAWLSQNKIQKKVFLLKKVTFKIHKYANSLNSKRKPPKISTLQKYLNLCRAHKAILVCQENVCL